MLFTKCILSPASPADGRRISVMSRHTLSDGKTPDTRIVLDGVDWLPRLGPPSRLIGAYYRGELDWDEFERGYMAHLITVAPDVVALRDESLDADVTLLCIEKDCTFCHRRLLAEAVRTMRGCVSQILR